MTKIENRMMGVGCFARQSTLARVLGRMMEAYSLGDWKDVAVEKDRTSKGCVALRKLMSGKSEIAGPGGDGGGEEKIAGFFLTFENQRFRLSLFTRRQGLLCSTYTACLENPALLRPRGGRADPGRAGRRRGRGAGGAGLPRPHAVGRRRAARWLESRDGDLVQFRSVWEGVPAVAWAARHGRPAVLEAHGFPSVELPQHFPDLDRQPDVMEKLVRDERHVLTRVARVLTHSRTGALYLRRLALPTERIAVVPNAVDPAVFTVAPAPADTRPLRVAYTGTLAPWQGLGTLLEALALLRGGPAPSKGSSSPGGSRPTASTAIGPPGPWRSRREPRCCSSRRSPPRCRSADACARSGWSLPGGSRSAKD